MREGWTLRPLGDVLRQVHRPVKVADIDVVPFAGVRWYAEGVYPRGDQPAASVKTKVLNRIERGDIVYNRMWATKASFGVVRDDAHGCLVTNDFPVFRAQDDLLPDFVALLFHWSVFQQAAAASATGTTERRRLNERHFAKLRVPIPSLREQRRIVDLVGALDSTIAAIARAGTRAVYEAALRAVADKFPAVPIGDVVDSAFAGGTPSRAEPEYFTGHIPWLKSGEVESDSIAETTEHISERALRSSAARLVPAGSTVVAMYGQGDTKGRAGFVVSPVATNQAVLALVPDTKRIDAKYLLHAVRSRTESLRRRAVGAAQPNLSKGLVLTELIPVPAELEEQIRWRDLLDSLRAAGSSQQAMGERLRRARSQMLCALLSREHEIPESYDELMEVAS